MTVRVVAEPSHGARVVSKIRVPNKEHKRHQSRRDAGDEKPTHCKAGLELSLKLSESPRVFQASCVYVALVRSDIIKDPRVLMSRQLGP